MFTRYTCSALLVCCATVSSAAAQGIRYVDDDAPLGGDGLGWTTAYKFLQDAMYEADGDPSIAEIRVAGGTHWPDHDEGGHVTPGYVGASFQLRDALALRGGYAGLDNRQNPDARDVTTYESTLSGEIAAPDDPTDNSYHVVVGDETDETSVIDGFTITAGSAHGWCDGGGWDDCPTAEGGGLRVSGGSPTIINCTFVGNAACQQGGAACIRGGSPTFMHCRFSDNLAYGGFLGGWGGGGMYIGNASPRLIECSFSGNAAHHGGGGICSIDSGATLIDCEFTANSTDYDGEGAALYMANLYTPARPTLTRCSFAGNQTQLRGGAVCIWGFIEAEELRPVFTGCEFSDNCAQIGGGLYVGGQGQALVPSLVDCTFNRNAADEAGGGMAVFAYAGGSGVSAALKNCTFSGNSAGGAGGGLLGGGHDIVLTDCTFIGNSAESAGGMRATILGSTLVDCVFVGNSATEGGGGMVAMGAANIIGCAFAGNNAQFGGGVEAGHPFGDPTLINCVFVGNSATEGGGVYGAEPTLANCTLIGNVAASIGGGITGDEPTLANCILWGNVAPSGAQAYGTASVTYSCLQGGWEGAGNISTTPLFGADLQLLPGSPCIDAGNNAAVPPDVADLDGDGDTTEPIPVDRSGRRRFIDDPSTEDTGLGDPPIVDMGAYEFRAPVSLPSSASPDHFPLF